MLESCVSVRRKEVICGRIMNEESDWDHNVEGDAVDCVSREEVVQALNKMKTWKAPGPSNVSLHLIVVNREVGIQVMVELCHGDLDGLRMPAEWALSIVIPMLKKSMTYRTVVSKEP